MINRITVNINSMPMTRYSCMMEMKPLNDFVEYTHTKHLKV